MKPARLILLAVAIIAGGLAALLASRGQAPVTVVETVSNVRQESKLQVLVAASAIGVGQRLTENSVMWQDWPEGAVRPEYITSQVLPDAPEQMRGTVARFEIFVGEPIRSAKLVRSDQGFLSAVISQGMRAVSIPVTAASGAGGYIVPNDRVDIVHTTDDGGGSISSTILQNIKVIALGDRLGQTGVTGGASADEEDPQAELFGEESIATLELSPLQSETIIAAAADGQLSLVLRSVVDFNEESGDALTPNQAIRVVRFGTTSNVQSNAVPTVTPASTTTGPSALAGAAMDLAEQPIFSISTDGSSQDQAAAPAEVKQ